jgi:hypothetical protein
MEGGQRYRLSDVLTIIKEKNLNGEVFRNNSRSFYRLRGEFMLISLKKKED